MDDEELLELAANAIGTNFVASESWDDGAGWNPLEDDGDALRLAVDLGLQVVNHFGFAEIVVPGARGDSGYVEADKGDPYAATRRAIVRAAAEVGLLKTPNV